MYPSWIISLHPSNLIVDFPSISPTSIKFDCWVTSNVAYTHQILLLSHCQSCLHPSNLIVESTPILPTPFRFELLSHLQSFLHASNLIVESPPILPTPSKFELLSHLQSCLHPLNLIVNSPLILPTPILPTPIKFDCWVTSNLAYTHQNTLSILPTPWITSF